MLLKGCLCSETYLLAPEIALLALPKKKKKKIYTAVVKLRVLVPFGFSRDLHTLCPFAWSVVEWIE